ncbi:MAG: FadR/GntR family transcriptional regulator [Planctomycetota bacterium]
MALSTEPFAVTSSGTTTDRLFQAMLERIRDGRWPVGSLLPGERKLIEEFGVSRIPLREALSTLRALGLIQTVHGRGSMVQAIDAQVLACLFPLLLSMDGMGSFTHVLEVRLALEGQTAYLAALRCSDADLMALRACHAELRAAIDSDDDDRYVEADREFHQIIARASGNPLFPVLLQSLAGYYAYYIRKSCQAHPPNRFKALDFHQRIEAAIAARDGQAAQAVMTEHLRLSATHALEQGLA